MTRAAGIDEVGYGCIFGPISCSAVVILDKEKLLENLPKHAVLRDSKKMTERQLKTTHDYLTKTCTENGWIMYGIGNKSSVYIDLHGLSKSRIDAFHESLDNLSVVCPSIDKILVDGNFFKSYKTIPHELIVKGDATVLEIMCASIIAKHFRDSLIYDFVDKHPEFELQEKYKIRDNVGYATRAHLDGIARHGPFSPFTTLEIGHRTSYSMFQNI